MADTAEDADEYGEDEYEAESPAATSPARRSRGSESDGGRSYAEPAGAAPSSPALAVPRRLLDESSGSDKDSDAASPPKRPVDASSSLSRRATGRHLLDNAAWTYAIEASRVRALRIPIADSAALRELRVFAVVDKQARQSRGSRWKAEAARSSRRPSLVSTGSSRSLASASGERRCARASSSPDRRQSALAGRRSGLLEEAKWTPGDGSLSWTLPMDKFRQLKAYNPRIKVFLYGVDAGGSGGGGDRGEALNLSPRRTAQAEAADIVGLGWFFLDLRTPDLPSRWVKLQNARYGGEVQIRSSFSPFEAPALAPPPPVSARKPASTRERDKVAAIRPTEAAASSQSELPAAASASRPLPQAIITDDAGDFLQLGARDGTDVFVVSVAISGARDLGPLVRRALAASSSAEVSGATAAGFWLSYSLFDVVVQTDVFHNLDAAEFPPIRDSFRVRSCLDDLRAFIDASHGGLPVFLCTQNQIIAGVTIPLGDLLDGDLFARDGGSQTPRPGATAKVGERFLFPDCESAAVLASVSIEHVGSATELLSHGEERTRGGQDVASQRAIIDTRDDSVIEKPLVSSASSAAQAPSTAVVKALVTHVRLANALLAPLVEADSVTASLTLSGSHAVELLQFCGFEKEFTTARLGQSSVVGTVDASDRKSGEFRVQLTATTSKRVLGEATMDVLEAIDSGTEAQEQTRSVPLRDEAGRPVGECVVRLGPPADTLGDESGRGMTEEDEEFGAREEQRRLYQLSLQVKAIRDVTVAGTYTIAFEHPFHQGVRAQSQPLAVAAKRETSVRDLAYCVSERPATLAELKQAMSGTVAIEIAPIGGRQSSSQTGGAAAFSLDYLYYSEERFCCPDAECRGTFSTDADAEAHWRESHAEGEGGEAYTSTSIKSCSIYVPVVGVDSARRGGSLSDPPPTGQQVGMVRIDAALEDCGPEQPTPVDGVRHPRLVPELRASPTRRSDALSHRSQPIVPGSSDVETRVHGDTLPVDATPDAAPSRRSPPPWQPPPEMLAEGAVEQEQERARRLAEWRQQLAEAERVRMDELEHEWARREEERAELLRAAQREYERLELRLREALADVETRERRLSVAEDALEREQRAHRDEMEALRKRLASDQSHTASLAAQQREALAQRVAQLESQLADAEQRAREVERDYAEYRRQQRKVPEARLREEIAALKGSVAELERQKLAEERAKLEALDAAARLRVQLESASAQVQEERKKHETHVVEELEKLRLKYIAREEKYVLDGDREELRAIKRQLDELRGIHERAGAATVDADLGYSDVATRPVGRRKRSPAKPPQRTQQHQQRATRTRYDPHQARDSDDRVQSRGSSDPRPLLQDRGEDQRSQRSSRASSDWDDTLDHAERSNGERHPRNGSRRRARVPSSSGSRSVDAAGYSDGEESEVNDSECYSPPRSENDAPVQPRRILSPFAAVASVASAAMSSGTNAGSAGSSEQELKRLQRERELLLSSGTYNSKSYLVRELDRLIATARGKMRL